MTDQNLEIVFYNNNVCQNLLYDKYELLERSISNIIDCKVRNEMQDNLYEIFEGILE